MRRPVQLVLPGMTHIPPLAMVLSVNGLGRLTEIC
jgi:hypothetical protein